MGKHLLDVTSVYERRNNNWVSESLHSTCRCQLAEAVTYGRYSYILSIKVYFSAGETVAFLYKAENTLIKEPIKTAYAIYLHPRTGRH